MRFSLDFFLNLALVWFDFDVYQFNLLLHISGSGQKVWCGGGGVCLLHANCACAREHSDH